jgi:hypothetical protein
MDIKTAMHDLRVSISEKYFAKASNNDFVFVTSDKNIYHLTDPVFLPPFMRELPPVRISPATDEIEAQHRVLQAAKLLGPQEYFSVQIDDNPFAIIYCDKSQPPRIDPSDETPLQAQFERAVGYRRVYQADIRSLPRVMNQLRDLGSPLVVGEPGAMPEFVIFSGDLVYLIKRELRKSNTRMDDVWSSVWNHAGKNNELGPFINIKLFAHIVAWQGREAIGFVAVSGSVLHMLEPLLARMPNYTPAKLGIPEPEVPGNHLF